MPCMRQGMFTLSVDLVQLPYQIFYICPFHYLGSHLMPSAHGPIFYRRQKIGVKIGSCALTFAPILNRSDLFSELLATKNQSCALTQSEKKSDLHSDFFSELLATFPCALGISYCMLIFDLTRNLYIFNA